jgi:hypothetical protein
VFVKTDGAQTVVQYPYTVGDLRDDNPNTSFPLLIPNDWQGLSEYNLFHVADAAMPEPSDPNLVVEEGTPLFVDGEWVQGYVERAPSVEEVNQKRRLLIIAIRAEFVTRVDGYAATAGLTQDDLNLIEGASKFAAGVVTMLFANNNQGFRDDVAAARTNASTLVAAANAATTFSELDAVDVTSGWPV